MALKNAHAGKAYPAGRAGRLDTDLAPPPGLSPSRGCQRQGGPRAGWGAFEQRGAWERGCVAAAESTSPSSTDLVAVIGLPVTGSPWRTPVRLPPRVRRTTGTAPDLRCREPAPQLIGHAIPGSGQIHSQRPSGRYWPAASAQYELDYLHLLKVKPKLRDLSMGHRCAKSKPPKQANMASGRDTWSCHRRRPHVR